jgi:signal transduction histidine kinase
MSMLEDNNEIREKLEQKLEELKKTQDMLVRSEKLAALGGLVSHISHEVNNPLMIISGNAQLALMAGTTEEEIGQYLKVIKEQCGRAKEIIQRLLKFSKPAKGEVKDVDVNSALEEVVKLVEHQFRLANVNIERRFHSGLPAVKIDDRQLDEVILNLLNNARDAMPEGGAITMTTSKEGDYVRVDIKDTGEGIPEQNLKKLMEPFFTTKKKGTGLGLSICYGIIKAYDGELKFESKVGEGTTATILLKV